MGKVTAKYQITIPKEIRASLNIMPGVEVGFKEEEGRFYLIKNPNSDPIEKWRGVIRDKRQTDETIAELRMYGF